MSVVPGESAELLTTTEAARYLRRRPAALRLLVRRAEISYYRVGRTILFRVSDLELFLARVYRPARVARGVTVATEATRHR